MITPIDKFTVPDSPEERARQHELMVASAEVFAAATDLARENNVVLAAHGTRHFEIIDGAKSVHVFVVEQRIEGKFSCLMHGFGRPWDIYDVLEEYIDARSSVMATVASMGVVTADKLQEPEKKRTA